MLSMRKPDETVYVDSPVDPLGLVPLAQLAAEGFGYDGLHVRAPREVVDALAAQLDGEVVLDDLGRRCVSRETARRLFAERVEADRRRREAQERIDAQFAAQAAANPVWTGIPAGWIPDGVAPAAAMLQAAKDAATAPHSPCSSTRWPTTTPSSFTRSDRSSRDRRGAAPAAV